jgi:hypothetical protein
MDPVPDTLLLRKSGGAGNQTRDLWICRHNGSESLLLTSIYSPVALYFGIEQGDIILTHCASSIQAI